jgi:hypothetical protein
MAKFVYIYVGGQTDPSQSQDEVMQAWGAWFATLGDSVDDMGNPFGGSATVTPTGTADGGASAAGGYLVISAGSLADAAAKARGCPILDNGGTVEVYEAVPM